MSRQSRIAEVLAYIANNPNCTSREMRKILGIRSATLHTYTRYLRDVGEIKRIKVSAREGGAWQVGEDEEMLKEAEARDTAGIVRRFVTTWEPHMVRDPLVAALFG